MEKSEIDKILEIHNKWIYGDGGEDTELRKFALKKACEWLDLKVRLESEHN